MTSLDALLDTTDDAKQIDVIEVTLPPSIIFALPGEEAEQPAFDEACAACSIRARKRLQHIHRSAFLLTATPKQPSHSSAIRDLHLSR